MSKPGKADFDYDYEKYQAILNELSAIVREAMRFIAQNDTLDAFMGDLVFNRGEPEAAKELRKRMAQAKAPDYLLAALTLNDFSQITNLYNHPISLLLRESEPPVE